MSSKLKIISDIDCQIYCDYEYVGDAVSGKLFHLNLRKGIYLLEFRKDTVVLATQRYKMESNDEEDLLEISLLDTYNNLQRQESREKIKNLSVIWFHTGDNWRIGSTKDEILNLKTAETWIDLPSSYILLPMGSHRDPDVDCCGYIPFNIGGTLHSDDLAEYFIEGGMWGCINKVGEVVIPPIYKGKVFFWNDEVTTIKENNVRKETINYQGEIAFKELGRVRPVDEAQGLYETIKENQHGLINKYGKYLIQPRYTELRYIGENYLWAKDIDSKRWGLLDIESNVILPFIYDDICETCGGYYVCSNGKWGSVTGNGGIIASPEYAIVSNFHISEYNFTSENDYDIVYTSYSIAKKNGKYGIIDTDFKSSFGCKEKSVIIREIIPCVYDAIYSKSGRKYSDEELIEETSSQLGAPDGRFAVPKCYFVTYDEGILHCNRYKINGELEYSFNCDEFNSTYLVRSNNYHFINKDSEYEEDSYDLISNIDFYDGTFDYQPNPDGWDGYSAPTEYIKVKNTRSYPIAKKDDTWYVFNNTIPRSVLFSCKCEQIIEFGNLVCGECFAIVERENSQYLYIIDHEGEYFETEAYREIHSSYYHLRYLEISFEDKYHVNGLSNDYFISHKTNDKYSILKWWGSKEKMIHSQEYYHINFIDESNAEVVLYSEYRPLYNILSTWNVDERFECIYGPNWMVSPYNERKYNWVAAYDQDNHKEGIILDAHNGGSKKIIIPFEYEYARIFGGQKSIIICLGSGEPEQIQYAILDSKKRYLTTEIFDNITVGLQINDLTFHIDNNYHADVNLDNDNLEYSLPFLDFDTYTESGDRIRKSPFENVRLYIDTETTGLPKDYQEHYTKLENWPYIVQVALIIEDDNYGILAKRDIIVKPDGYTIPESASNIHGITNEKAKSGEKREDVFNYLDLILNNTDIIIGHNASFDLNIIKAEIIRTKGIDNALFEKKEYSLIDTMRLGKDVCKIPRSYIYGDYKYPKLNELYYKLFNKHFDNQHNAMADVEATYECYKELLRLGIYR